MKVGELKELLKDVPDNYTVGYTEKNIHNDNWYGESISMDFVSISKDLNANMSKNNYRYSH